MCSKPGFMVSVLAAAAVMLMPGLPAAANEIKGITGINMPTGDMAIREPAQPMELLSEQDAAYLSEQMTGYVQKEETLLKNKASTYYYYENLDPVAKEIYDVMYCVAQDPVSEGNVGLMMTDMDPQSDEYYYEFNLASRAICFDHPELFWLYSGEKANIGYYSEAVNMGGLYFVYIKMIEPYEEFTTVMHQFNQAADTFLADIDTSASEYEIVRQIHDKLLDLVNYNDPVANRLSISLSRGQDLAHTAYGALVADSEGNSNYAVCDGYTLAFEYLLQQCGIESVFIVGMAGENELSAGGHAWNMVKVDGVWYEADCTWDDAGNIIDDIDPESTDGRYYMEALEDPVYREMVDHYLFLVSTEKITHFIPGDEYQYITKDQAYGIRLVSESVHIRMTDDGSKRNCDPAVIALAPTAMQNYR